MLRYADDLRNSILKIYSVIYFGTGAELGESFFVLQRETGLVALGLATMVCADCSVVIRTCFALAFAQ